MPGKSIKSRVFFDFAFVVPSCKIYVILLLSIFTLGKYFSWFKFRTSPLIVSNKVENQYIFQWYYVQYLNLNLLFVLFDFPFIPLRCSAPFFFFPYINKHLQTLMYEVRKIIRYLLFSPYNPYKYSAYSQKYCCWGFGDRGWGWSRITWFDL